MRIAFAGTPAVAIPTLEALLKSEHEIVAVITQPPAAQGRSNKPQSSAVATFAAQNNLLVIEPESINAPQTIETLKDLKADLAVVVAYGQLLKNDALQVFPNGWVNAHFSLLPAWRGAAPVQAAIIHGDEVTGVTTFALESSMDSGAIFGQVTTQVGTEETAGELLDRLSVLGAELVLQTVNAIESGEAKPVPQNNAEISFAPKLSPAEGQINWKNPALAINRHIRGFTPKPGAWTTLDGNRIEIGPVEILQETQLLPGQIRVNKSEVCIGTGSSEIKLGDVKPAGKSWMSAGDWARGLRENSGAFTNG
jgi:methionyl-tRNA formyltransferase